MVGRRFTGQESLVDRVLPDAVGDRPDSALSDFATETGDLAKTFIENAIKSNDGARPGRLIPLTVDGLIYASSMVMLDSSARRGTVVAVLARWLLGLGIAATLAAKVAHGLGHGVVGATVAAWPALALVGSYELLMMVIRGSQKAPGAEPCNASTADPLQQQAAEIFAGQLAADRVPSIRAIRAHLHVGQPRAQRLRGLLAEGVTERSHSSAV